MAISGLAHPLLEIAEEELTGSETTSTRFGAHSKKTLLQPFNT